MSPRPASISTNLPWNVSGLPSTRNYVARPAEVESRLASALLLPAIAASAIACARRCFYLYAPLELCCRKTVFPGTEQCLELSDRSFPSEIYAGSPSPASSDHESRESDRGTGERRFRRNKLMQTFVADQTGKRSECRCYESWDRIEICAFTLRSKLREQ